MILTKTQNGIEVPLSEEEGLDFQQKELDYLQAVEDAKAVQYKENRQREYPSLNDMLVALIEEKEGRPESLNSLMLLRQQVKNKYPKPVKG